MKRTATWLSIFAAAAEPSLFWALSGLWALRCLNQGDWLTGLWLAQRARDEEDDWLR